MPKKLGSREGKGLFNKPGRPLKTDRRGIGGRPTVFTPETITKLERAYMYGMTDEEASIFAGIKSAQTLRNYISKNPEFKYRKHQLKSYPVMKARMAAVDKCDETYGNAVDLLSRIKKDEFSLRHDTESNNQTIVINLTERQQNLIMGNYEQEDLLPEGSNVTRGTNED